MQYARSDTHGTLCGRLSRSNRCSSQTNHKYSIAIHDSRSLVNNMPHGTAVLRPELRCIKLLTSFITNWRPPPHQFLRARSLRTTQHTTCRPTCLNMACTTKKTTYVSFKVCCSLGQWSQYTVNHYRNRHCLPSGVGPFNPLDARPRTGWGQLITTISPWTSGSTRLGGRQEIGTFGTKLSVRQRSIEGDRQLIRRRRKATITGTIIITRSYNGKLATRTARPYVRPWTTNNHYYYYSEWWITAQPTPRLSPIHTADGLVAPAVWNGLYCRPYMYTIIHATAGDQPHAQAAAFFYQNIIHWHKPPYIRIMFHVPRPTCRPSTAVMPVSASGFGTVLYLVIQEIQTKLFSLH